MEVYLIGYLIYLEYLYSNSILVVLSFFGSIDGVFVYGLEAYANDGSLVLLILGFLKLLLK